MNSRSCQRQSGQRLPLHNRIRGEKHLRKGRDDQRRRPYSTKPAARNSRAETAAHSIPKGACV